MGTEYTENGNVKYLALWVSIIMFLYFIYYLSIELNLINLDIE